MALWEPALLTDGWVLLSFSMPEEERDKRHVLRSKLMWLGLGNVSSGLWIGPAQLCACQPNAPTRCGC